MKKISLLTALLCLGVAVAAAEAEESGFYTQGSNKSYIQIPHFAVPADLTVEAWIYVPDVSGTKTIVCWKNVAGGANGDAVLFRLYNNKLQCGEYIGQNWKEASSSANISVNTWTHVAVTRSGSTAKCYVNGALSGTATLHASPLCNTETLTIGAITTTPSESFKGYIREVRIWSVARTDAEISSVYSSALSGSEPGLEGYWLLQAEAEDFTDLSPRERNGTLITSERGRYFSKKTYDGATIPTYSENREQLPKPVLDGNPEWVDMYSKAWELAFAHMKAPQSGSPFVSNYYDEAFDGGFYQWDVIFMTMFGKYAHHIFPGIQSLDNFYCSQNSSGSISRTINEATGNDAFADGNSNQINPPLFSWAEVENFKVTGDKSRFASVLPALEKYFEYVEKVRGCPDTPHKLYWSNGQSSGMDNTPRDEGRPNTHWASDHQGWVDASAQMVIQCNNIATICDELGNAEKAAAYRAKATAIADSINSWMWSEADGIYYDLQVNGTQMRWKSIAAFWPMLAGITTPHQVSALMAHLKNPNEFWRDMVFPTLAASDPDYRSNGGYWLGAVWAPTNYAVIKGLELNGQNVFAKDASERYIAGLYDVFEQTGTLWENYAADTTINGRFRQGVNDNISNPSDCRKDFVGWTGLGPISLLIENVLGFRMDGVTRTLTYDLRRTDRHGIENLRMADITTSVITDSRSENSEEAHFTVTSDKPYTLKVFFNDKVAEYNITAGTQEYDIIPSLANMPSSDATLSSLTVGGKSLSPAFSADSTSYTVEVESSVSSIDLAATPAHPQARVEGTGSKSLNYGDNPFEIVVTAEDTSTTKTYTVTVTRKISTSVEGRGTREVTLYPNPASEYVTLGGVPAEELVQVFDLNGLLWINVRTSVANENLYVGHLPAGGYVCKTSREKFKIIKSSTN
ncbi:MAG: cadherin-like beta sandwich domain-containing protein [Prevotellaceae bacterium]|jgi:hypothetical protein|nr:cadherin-like beta sandwich domain-containing protein [Prevotellaceae bacterium]